MRIAALDDEVIELELIKHTLSAMGHDCHAFTDGTSFLRAMNRESFDMLLIDWQMPGISGLDVVRWVRENIERPIPILFITNRTEERDIVDTLTAGADDFMAKPVRVRELMARVSALIRRTYPPNKPNYTFGAYRFIPLTSQVEINGEIVTLKRKEYELAYFLFQNAGQLLSRDHLREQIWNDGGNHKSRSLDTHLSRIRNKLHLRPDQGWNLISVYGLGCRLERHEENFPSPQSPDMKLKS